MPAQHDQESVPFPERPELVKIRWYPDDRTDTIGQHASGLFYAAGCSLMSNLAGVDPYDDATRRRYDYLHTFTPDGHHVASDIRFAGYGRGGVDLVPELLSSLVDIEFGDIAIRPFLVEFEGYQFGLVDESDAERGPWFELYPNGLGFHPPFDGDYDT